VVMGMCEVYAREWQGTCRMRFVFRQHGYIHRGGTT
jgi:hypothetical protein